ERSPRAPRYCPHCDARIKDPDARKCWLCGEPLEPGQLLDRPSILHELAKPRRVWAAGDNPVMDAFGSLALVLLELLVGVGLASDAPGVLLILLVALTPALIRTLVTTYRQRAEGEKVSAGRVILTFLSSVGVVVVVGLAATAAFYATCFAVCLAGLAISGGE